LILLLGDAGVGKTRLADELAEWSALEHGARHIESRCVPYGEANIWYPIGAALYDLLQLGEDASPSEALQRTSDAVAKAFKAVADSPTVTQAVNSLLYLMGYEDPLRHLEPQRAREEATRSLVRFLEAVCAERPLFFRLADLHWADDLVLGLIDDLLNRLNRSAFCLVAGARHLLDPRWAPRAGRHNNVVVNLDPLDEAAAADLLEHLLGRKDLSPPLRSTLLARSGGNPFFLEELVALTGRSDEHVELDRPLEWTASQPLDSELPETLRGLVAARLDRMPPEERIVIEDAAVIGHSGPLYALEKMAARTGSEATWCAALDRLVDKEVLEVSGSRWSFRSDLVREVAYSTLTKSDRARRHADIAQWMEEHIGGEGDDAVVDRIAFHYGVAATLAQELGLVVALPSDLVERALRWLGQAGRRAQAAEVHVLADRLFSHALDLAGSDPTAQRLEFLLRRAEARWGLYELEAAAVDVDAALEVAAALGDDRGRAKALLARAEVEQRDGGLAAAHATLDEALAAFRSLGDRRGEAEALRQLGMTRLFQRAYKEAEASTQEALSNFCELDDRRGEAWALQNLAWVAYLSGRVTEAELRIDQSAATFAELGDQAGLAWANGLLAFTRFHQGHLAEAEQLAEHMLPDAHERGDRFGEAMMLLLTGLVRLWSGRTTLAVERADEARVLFSRIGDSLGQGQAEATYGRAMVASGRVEEGLRNLEDALARSRRNQALSGTLLGSLALASAALHIGDVDVAASQLAALTGPGRDMEEIGGAERAAAVGLIHLQQDEPEQGAAVLSDWLAAEADASPNVLAALALCLVSAGDTRGALHAADRAHNSQRATYLDLAQAYTASGLAFAVRGDTSEMIAAFASARQEVDSTGDVVAQAVVRLAESFALAAVQAMSARAVRRESERLLATLRIPAEGWVVVFRAAQRWRGAAAAAS
jgi:predicted ATPase